MDDHHIQPIWPMVQGAANYAWNLIEEAWGMIWKPAAEPRARAMEQEPARAPQAVREMREVGLDTRSGQAMKTS
jgi:hypothetical protein